MIGKVPPELLAELVVGRTGAKDDAVLQGPAYGEDAAAIDVGDVVLVVSTDPISLAADRAGTLGVAVACNDVAASGATPRWLTSAVFLPDDDAATLDRVTTQLDEAARARDVAIVGGHTEYAPALSRPLLSLTCAGLADRYVPSGGAEPGDRVVLAGTAGIEAAAILATDFRDRVAGTVPDDAVERAAGFFDDVGVVEAGLALAPHASAMHDPTEGGLATGLYELAAASGVALRVDADAVPVREETRLLCDAAGVDPLRTFGSGALVATVPEGPTEAALDALADEDVPATDVGEVLEAPEPVVELGSETVDGSVRDEMYELWE